MGAEVKAVDAEEKKTVVPLHYPINYGYYGHYSPLTHYYGKREAEAEPTADADADAKADPWLAYSGYAGYPYAYGHSGYLPYVSHPVVKSVVKAADGEKKTVVPYALPYGGLYNYGYGYSGYPVVKTVAGKHIVSPLTTYHGLGKRSAEAEPVAGIRILRLRTRTRIRIRTRPRIPPQLLQWIPLPLRIRWIRISLLRIRISRQDFYMDICPDTTQMCSESQSQNVESHLIKEF